MVPCTVPAMELLETPALSSREGERSACAAAMQGVAIKGAAQLRLRGQLCHRILLKAHPGQSIEHLEAIP